MSARCIASLRKSTGQSQNRCVTGAQNAPRTAKEPSKEQILTRLSKSFMGVFSNDFAAVDFREELCYHSRPEKANSRDVKQLVMKLLCIFPWKSFDGFSNNFRF